jgi:hypothetical protein
MYVRYGIEGSKLTVGKPPISVRISTGWGVSGQLLKLSVPSNASLQLKFFLHSSNLASRSWIELLITLSWDQDREEGILQPARTAKCRLWVKPWVNQLAPDSTLTTRTVYRHY